jgi:hypothetical protein
MSNIQSEQLLDVLLLQYILSFYLHMGTGSNRWITLTQRLNGTCHNTQHIVQQINEQFNVHHKSIIKSFKNLHVFHELQ